VEKAARSMANIQNLYAGAKYATEICNDIPGSWNADDFSADYVAAVMDWGREIRKYG